MGERLSWDVGEREGLSERDEVQNSVEMWVGQIEILTIDFSYFERSIGVKDFCRVRWSYFMTGGWE